MDVQGRRNIEEGVSQGNSRNDDVLSNLDAFNRLTLRKHPRKSTLASTVVLCHSVFADGPFALGVPSWVMMRTNRAQPRVGNFPPLPLAVFQLSLFVPPERNGDELRADVVIGIEGRSSHGDLISSFPPLVAGCYRREFQSLTFLYNPSLAGILRLRGDREGF